MTEPGLPDHRDDSDASPARDEVPAGLDRGLLALSTRRPVAMLMVVATVVVFGVISFYQLPRNLMPDISYPTVTVRTDFPGAAPIDVEDRISERLESVLSQVKGLRRISSISRAEVSEIILEFTWGTDMGQASLEIREKIDQAVLPDEVEKPTILRYDPTLDPILQLGFYRELPEGVGRRRSGEQVSDLIQLRIRAEEIIEKDLELIPGVAAVEVRGGFEREIRISVDESRLAASQVDLDLVSRRLREENMNLASGIIYEGEQALIVRSVNEFRDLEEIRNIVLRRIEGVPVRLDSVARVTFGYRDPEVLTRFDGNPCVKIDLFKEADANLVEVARRVRERISGTPRERELLRRYLEHRRKAPESKQADEEATGVVDLNGDAEKAGSEEDGEADGEEEPDGKKAGDSKGKRGGGGFGLRRPRFLESRLRDDEKVVVMSDQSVFIQNSLEEVRLTAIFGGFLAILVLYLFLRNLWFTVIVGLAIPLSVIATFASMKLLDVSLNIMSLGGLALGVGMLVDNSIVVLESIFRCREAGDGPRLAAVRGGRSVAAAVTASTLTTVAVFFPIVFIEGVAGQVFRDQALTVVVSLLASLAVSLTFIPTLVSRQLSGSQAPKGGWMQDASGASRFGWIADRFSSTHSCFPERLILFILLTPVYSVCQLVTTIGVVIELIGRLLRWILSLVSRLLRFLLGGLSRLLGGFSGGVLGLFDRAWKGIENTYPKVLRGALAMRGGVLLVALVLAAGSGWLFLGLGSELIPEVHQGEFTVELELPVGTRIEKTDATISPLEKEILDLPAVQSVASTIGVERDSMKSGEEGEHTARLLVRTVEGRRPAEVEEEVKAAIRDLLLEVLEITDHRIRNPVLFSFKTPIEVEVKGYNLEELQQLASRIEARMSRIASIKDVKSSVRPGFPEVHLVFDRELLNRYSLDIGTIGNAIRRKVDGEVPTRFTEGDRKVDLRVRLEEEDRASLENLRELLVNPGGEIQHALGDVARIVEGVGPAEIRRIGQTRAAVVSANLAGLDLGRATEEIGLALSDLDVPAEFTVGFGGQQQEMESSRDSLLRALILAIFLVYVVMAAQFESMKQPFVILFSIPLAGTGIAPVLYFLDEPLSVIVFIGMIMLAGIVVNNAIVLIDCINQLRRSGLGKFDAIAQAGQLRLRPILMTTTTTVLGLLPLTGALNLIPGAGEYFAQLLGVGEGLEIRAPMAITVIAGLLSSTILTLFVIPVVYSLTDRRD